MATPTPLTLLGDPVLARIAQDAHSPFFDERTPEKWAAFEIEWELYWNRLTTGREYGEIQKLMVLESSLSEGLKIEIALINRESGRPMSFTPVWAMLQSRFAPVKTLSARKEWYALNMKNEGRETRAEFNEL